MPLYEYECDRHGSFTLVRPMSRASEAGACPACGEDSPRVISLPTLFTMPLPARRAAARNERSRHEPAVRRSGCGQRHAAAATRAGRPKLQAYTGARPWVVEHR